MGHNLSYRGPIWVIQNPNIKFSDRNKSFLMDSSPNSLFFPSRKSIPKTWTVGSAKIGQLGAVPGNGP